MDQNVPALSHPIFATFSPKILKFIKIGWKIKKRLLPAKFQKSKEGKKNFSVTIKHWTEEVVNKDK